ncbi:putative histidine ammonia-lyase [Tieghemostelium lacteum]|uniref:Putative histidine ammonia-lyase n=1 Tax=Tieghemostelium lacteum TaxID=361077 RepID=A0A152A9G8_TIELA|nr:putative histidine ammonia-lyase [Tieghemostelium lacteum]|eukprot:KYR02869.1 putative histidine ammonia-lyase [Tieghemostelium lacteum]
MRKEIIIQLDNSEIEIEDINLVANGKVEVKLSKSVFNFLEQGREQLEKRLVENHVIYGINTGFGGNANVLIGSDLLQRHQCKLLDSLNCGTGDYFPIPYVRASQFIIVLALSRGWSAVRPVVVKTLLQHLNLGITPQVPIYGSVGASGDLLPLSYIAQSLCGKGMVYYKGNVISAQEALSLTGISEIKLQSKEGLALINGTRVISAVSSLTLHQFEKCFEATIGAVSLIVEALQANTGHYDNRIHLIKGHPGQIQVANMLRQYLDCDDYQKSISKNVEIMCKLNSFGNEGTTEELNEPVQEVYSLRCAPQILGVIIEQIQKAKETCKIEYLSVNDNPLIDPYNGDPLSGGNFMGNHMARVMDGIKIDITLVANHLHSLVALLMHKHFSRGLPNSLSAQPGLSGLKGMQISHSSLVAWLRQEASPACIHNLVTEQFNQDVVSLGLHSAWGSKLMIEKLLNVISMTLIIACQAIDLRKEKLVGNFKLSTQTEMLYNSIRKIVPKLIEDRVTDIDIKSLSVEIQNSTLPFLKFQQ